MGLLGLIVGAFVGSLGGAPGALLGAVIGLMAGSAMRGPESQPVPEDSWKRNVEHALKQLNRRVQALEQDTGAVPVLHDGVLETVVPEVPEPVQPQPDPRPRPAAPREVVRPAPATSGPETPSDGLITRWLLGGNTLVRVGVILLFFGVAFLLKFVADRDLVPLELRLAGIAMGGVALLAVGWRLRARRPDYALMLQGGGVGVLYMTVFAALRLYQMLPHELAFGLLAGISACGAVLAVVQDSRALAITGVIGGFLAPILASTGGGNHVTLFGYYAVLNAGIVAIAYHKAWREFNLIGFTATFGSGLAWGSRYYRPELFASTEAFLVLFFLFYVTIAVLFAMRQAPRLTDYVDGTIVFGTPVAAFAMQLALVREMTFGAAWSAFTLAALYVALATALYARRRDTLRLLVESFLALGVGFATLAVPLAFDGGWTSAIWAVEGAALLWVGVRQGRMVPRVVGMLLQPAAGYALLTSVNPVMDPAPLLNRLYLGSVMVSAAALFCSRYLESRRVSISDTERHASLLLFLWGAVWWFTGGVAEIHRHAQADWTGPWYLLFFAGSCGAFGWLWRRLDWELARNAALALLPLMAVVLFLGFAEWGEHRHPFMNHAYLGWSLAFGVHLWVLRAHERRKDVSLGGFHAAGFWLLTLVLSLETAWQINRYVEGLGVWPLIAWALVPGVLLAALTARGTRLGWPIAAHRSAYMYAGGLPLALFLLGWIVCVNLWSDGNPAPLPYAPLLNPLDLAQAGALLAVAGWYLAIRRLALPEATLPDSAAAMRLLGAVLFVGLNGVLLRTLHHYADLPWRLEAMWSSSLVQASFSLLWSLLALVAMALATRRRLRDLWIVGAALLAVVVAKLFLVDLVNTGTIERVVSFLGVGILVIVVGYFAPVPPRSQEQGA